MTQNELDFLQEAMLEKVDKMLLEVVNNANAQVKKTTEKPKETKKGETK
jgi:hypothetical protein